MKAGVMILLLTGCTRRTEIHMDGLRKESFSETEQERQTEEQTGVSSVIYVYVCRTGSGYMYIRRKRYRHLQRMLRRRQAASREEMRHTEGST